MVEVLIFLILIEIALKLTIGVLMVERDFSVNFAIEILVERKQFLVLIVKELVL
jgi:hypothetical protein